MAQPPSWTGVIDDYYGHIVATVASEVVNATTLSWHQTRSIGYGPAPDSPVHYFSEGASLTQSTAWRGKRQDITGYYYLGARYYEPSGARFLSPDPMGHSASMSLYDYAGGDPVNFVDPTGRMQTLYAIQKSNPSTPQGQIEMFSPSSNAYRAIRSIQEGNPDGLNLERWNHAYAPSIGLSKDEWNGLGQRAKLYAANGSGSLSSNPPEPTWTQNTVKDALQFIAALGNGINIGYGGSDWRDDSSDQEVTPRQLFYEWAYARGPSKRVFDESSVNAKGLMQTDYVAGAVNSRDNRFNRSLGGETLMEQILYPLDIGFDALYANPTRGFHGSIDGSIDYSNGMMNIISNDNMTSISGVRLPPFLGGYRGGSAFPIENPYGEFGPLRTIKIEYNIQLPIPVFQLEHTPVFPRALIIDALRAYGIGVPSQKSKTGK